jgi:hypothetical protein
MATAQIISVKTNIKKAIAIFRSFFSLYAALSCGVRAASYLSRSNRLRLSSSIAAGNAGKKLLDTGMPDLSISEKR